jgi:mannose-1-phosphate guanylyltransferase
VTSPNPAGVWAVVLAGGDGRRLQALTTAAGGMTVPKQYCSLQGGASLLQAALRRARAVVPTARLCAIVSAQHRMWRFAQLRSLLDANVIEQPHNRGTAHGVLLPLLHILERDPAATILWLPADHHVADEAVFAAGLHSLVACAVRHPKEIYLLGAPPDAPDTELGYVIPQRHPTPEPSPLAEFVEKPSVSHARTLIERGALWNTFIMAASGRALLGLFDDHYAPAVSRMRQAIARRMTPHDAPAFASWYETLCTRDFSRDVLQGQEPRVTVVRLGCCGWSDLGTPGGVADTLARLPPSTGAASLISDAALGLDLATQHWQVEFTRNAASPGRISDEPADPVRDNP